MDTLKLMAVGDITLQTKNNEHPFKYVMNVFENNDILFGNLETVLSATGKEAKKSVVLKSSPESINYLNEAGFNILNISNNHILDLGLEGFKNTLSLLDENKLEYIGAGFEKSSLNSAVIERNGIKLGFLGYTIGRFKVPEEISISKIKEKKIISDIELIKGKCDFVVVSLHWGTENVFYPSPKQIELAHELIDHGATLILGHHPHVLQGIEKYKNGLIAYSLGNFQFDCKLSQSSTNDSIILCVEFDKNGINDFQIIPVVINEVFAPIQVEGEVKEKISNFIFQISKPFIDEKITNKWWFEEIGEEYLIGNINSYVTRIMKYGIIPLFECMIWFLTPFCIQCYIGILRKNIKSFLYHLNVL
ncbi:poly-gamma-glutamate biosynthesis protein [Methanosarcina mazei]|uniref:Poly-gamma-glutamate biosynthesis protein n=2 Tax=Methanosarcina mazei TaxID=2209 RepID=A0A0F8MB87_METMZ|nr:CapA family protein [Methanosarcina mazei]KKG99369.1 poly-gamma-glutamate biosynthesis protein [Methanosarcina mazei]KKH00362.1 poly-gamma-glutamate biosynthesis protein [Methanosarcina mazei]KKH02831.1 poly-gamma-glutamate biosynthesis protein [Methanosarcina mazei]